MTASRLACALVSSASVATTASVVLVRGLPLVMRLERLGRYAGGKPRPPNSPSRSKGAAQNHGPCADRDAAGRIDGGQRADAYAVALERRRADAALQVDGGGAEPGAGAAEREVDAGAAAAA